MVTHSLEELLSASSTKFAINAKRLYTPQGGEVDDVKLIRDDDILYVSAGESFIKPNDANSVKDNTTSRLLCFYSLLLCLTKF